MHNILSLYERNKLFAVGNGLLLCSDAEIRISEGLMATIDNQL